MTYDRITINLTTIITRQLQQLSQLDRYKRTDVPGKMEAKAKGLVNRKVAKTENK